MMLHNVNYVNDFYIRKRAIDFYMESYALLFFYKNSIQ